jgi:hypothetical protein
MLVRLVEDRPDEEVRVKINAFCAVTFEAICNGDRHLHPPPKAVAGLPPGHTGDAVARGVRGYQ